MLLSYMQESLNTSVNGSKTCYNGSCFGDVKGLESGCTLSKHFELDFYPLSAAQ